jgi:diaminohydroxyphosphoribosylaminopyrimidine deaminase/5-amino-6-(5-phosphoribosylamino)uracil reductase
METGCPQIFIKSALSKEGYYSDLARSKKSLSNSYSNQITQMLRAKLDAVLVGPTTIYVDLPGLDFRRFDLGLPELENGNSFIKETDDIQVDNIIFTRTLFESISNHISLTFHISKLVDYQPFRIFVMSLKKLPDPGFFQKQRFLNEKLGSKKVIFFLLDFEVDNPFHQNMYIKMTDISCDLPVIVIDRDELMPALYLKFSDLSLNTVLVEGGNLLYKMFSTNLRANDSIYFIHTENLISEGIFPEINLNNRKKNYQIKIDTDIWEVYGE